MKSLLGMIIWICVGVGAVSAVAAYFVPTTLDAELYRSANEEKKGPNGYAVLASPAGPDVPRDGGEGPQWPAGTELTPEVVGAMSARQDDGGPLVRRVHLAEFSFARWSHKWYFLGSVIVLTLSGLGQKVLSGNGQLKKGAADPVDSLAAAIAEIKSVHADVLAMQSDKARMAEIVERVGELQQTHLANFPEARDVIVARGGLAKYANVMDAFAGGERKVNRAWSAAADGDLGESVENLELAVPLLEEAAKRLR